MGATLFYRRRASPLHATRATVASVWAGALIAATLLSESPLVLGALLLGVLGAGAGAGLGHELARTLRTVLIVAIPIVLVNVLVSHEGFTVFARLGDLGPFGQGDLTVEALVYGAVIALTVGLLMLVTTLASLAIDPDELLAVFRRRSFRSALTASLATRMIGVLSADSQRLAEAQRTRPGGAAKGARARVRLLSAIVGSSLDRSMDVAATLELRGFAMGTPRGRRAPRRPFSRHDRAFAASAAAVLALALLGRLVGAAQFDAYPLLSMPVSGATFVLCAALPAAVMLPLLDRRGIEL
ncbi:MAG TPA: energy-coupling factor transporter transmembrane component T [Solirubrobacteraceae bacterium]|nr:energy-coupling factor transporter transmembrane component T [Solirubrobacteraceae bacterium]